MNYKFILLVTFGQMLFDWVHLIDFDSVLQGMNDKKKHPLVSNYIVVFMLIYCPIASDNIIIVQTLG